MLGLVPDLRVLLAVVLALIGAALLRFLYRAYTIRKRFKQLEKDGIPLLPHSWFSGHVSVFNEFSRSYPSDINIGQFHVWIMQNFQKYFPGHEKIPPVIYLDLWPFLEYPVLIAYDASVAAQFTQARSLDKHQLSRDFWKPLTQQKDFSNMQGEEWKGWRSSFNPGFSYRSVSAMIPDMIDEIEGFVKRFEDKAGKDGSWGPMFSLLHEFAWLTYGVVTRVVLDEHRGENDPLKLALEEQLKLTGFNIKHFLAPWRYNQLLRKNYQVTYNELQRIAEQGLTHGPNESQKKTVLNLALQHLADEKRSVGDSERLDLLVTNLITFLVAGHETTASSLCFLIKVLQDHPSALVKMRAEHDEVLGPNPDEAVERLRAAPQLLNSLRYTNAVIKEMLRLYQLAAAMKAGEPGFLLTLAGMRYPTEGFLMLDGGPGIQRDPALWPRADDFVPERWLVPEGDPMHPPKDAWRPFAKGPRDCIGKDVAMVEMRLAAALIIRKFDIEQAWDEWDAMKRNDNNKKPDMVDGYRMYLTTEGIGNPKDGMPVRIKLR